VVTSINFYQEKQITGMFEWEVHQETLSMDSTMGKRDPITFIILVTHKCQCFFKPPFEGPEITMNRN